jgi:hypothetical protein
LKASDQHLVYATAIKINDLEAPAKGLDELVREAKQRGDTRIYEKL